MLQANQRYVFFYDLYLKTLPDTPEDFNNPISLGDILPDLDARFKSDECYKEYEKGRVGMRILDMDVQDSYVALLVAYADKQTADPSFMHLVTGVARTEHKQQGEGGAFSAHLVIQRNPKTNNPYSYTAALEKIPGATKSAIFPFLNTQLKESSSFSYRNKQKKRIKCYPKVLIYGHLAKKFKTAIQSGELKDVELVSNDYDPPGLDDKTLINTISQSIKIKVERKITGNTAVDLVNKIRNWAKSINIDELKVHYRGETKDEQFKVPNLSTDVGEFSMVRYDIIDLDQDANQMEETIRPDVVERIISLSGF